MGTGRGSERRIPDNPVGAAGRGEVPFADGEGAPAAADIVPPVVEGGVIAASVVSIGIRYSAGIVACAPAEKVYPAIIRCVADILVVYAHAVVLVFGKAPGVRTRFILQVSLGKLYTGGVAYRELALYSLDDWGIGVFGFWWFWLLTSRKDHHGRCYNTTGKQTEIASAAVC